MARKRVLCKLHDHSKLSESEDEFQVEEKTAILFSSRTETTVVMSSPDNSRTTEEPNVMDA